ncbi:hypothetical protein [Micromonospora sp. NPDC023633]|uniref:hypothetical protein n=1 Tax=Micromonospora sp. NPDC023633 TaxID=3154320 RepID=UPI0033CFB3D5
MTQPATRPAIEPVERLDPDSPKGRQIAADLTRVLAEIELEIRQRKAAEQAADTARSAA